MLFLNSCKDEGCNMVLNNVSFRTTLDPQKTSPVNNGGWTYAEGGSCGLIVSKGENRILAFDRCNINRTGKLIVEGLIVIDPESGAKWLLKDGSPIEKAVCSLHEYRVEISGNLIVVSN